MSTGSCPESVSQAILAGRFLLGRLGVLPRVIKALFYAQITYIFVTEMKEACKELRDNRPGT